jgi:D-glycero-D-manno-heptose 1,7-bisphosphate phosphatase
MIWKPGPAVAGPPRPVLFVDRDGCVIEDRDYLADPDGVALIEGAAAAMCAARDAGFGLVCVSNQSGLGRGRFGPAQLDAVMRRMEELLAAEGAVFDAILYCPHAPEQDCACRKPEPGLLEEAARFFAWPPELSWVIGDKASDVALGRGHGLGGVLVRTGYGAQQEEDVTRRYAGDDRTLVADDLADAVRRILQAAAS